ncbi:MAG: acyl-CoA carboxylase epsilon subunit [Cellulomonadaceae bacterium]
MSEPAPSVRIVRGQPDEIELAALVAGLAATGAGAGTDDEQDATGTPPRRWSDWRRSGAPDPVRTRGQDAWRWSLHP